MTTHYGDEKQLHAEAKAHDAGQRSALRTMIKAVTEMAEEQAKRSAATARNHREDAYAANYARNDAEVHVALLLVLDELPTRPARLRVTGETGEAA